MTNRKILVFGRHGIAPQTSEGSVDALIPQSVTALYQNVGVPLQAEIVEAGITQDRTYLVHSPRVRTRYTGQSVIAGALSLVPISGNNPPTSQEDLARYDFSGIENFVDDRLNFGEPFINMPHYKAAGNVATAAVNYWLSHPDATEHDGAAIESYTSIRERTSRAVGDALTRLLRDEKDFGVLVSHSGLPEAMMISLLSGYKGIEVTSCDQIGGPFRMEDFARVVIDINQGRSVARIERNGDIYNIVI